jgi:hypothetical protein
MGTRSSSPDTVCHTVNRKSEYGSVLSAECVLFGDVHLALISFGIVLSLFFFST